MPDDQTKTDWRARFTRTVAEELRAGVRCGALTPGEAELLLSRLRVVVDQALEASPHYG